MCNQTAQLTDRITQDPAVMVGKPVVAGTRIPVELVLGHLANNPDLNELFAAYPELTVEDVKADLAFAQVAVAARPKRPRQGDGFPERRTDVRFVLDQSADARLGPHLQRPRHDAIRIGRDYPPGPPDEQVLAIAERQGRIRITADRDFGELVFSRRQPHAGVILFRLGPYAELSTKIE